MKPEEIYNKRILFSVLNWGMGHVSRSIPIIQQLKNQGNTILIACSNTQRGIFEVYFLDTEFIPHEDYPFTFNGKGNFLIDTLSSFNKLNKRRKEEILVTTEIVTQNSIDICISDHRYGFYSNMCISIFITHQVRVAVPFYLKWVNIFHHRLMKSFDIIWVLDDDSSSFAGRLSSNKRFKNLKYIGPKSRFSLYGHLEKEDYSVVIISGPFPYNQQYFKAEVIKALKSEERTIIITPQLFGQLPINSKNVEQVVSNNWKEIDQIILKAKKIISRTGYSTIMDIHLLKCEKELSPTKGQWEQEYLAKR